MRRAFHDPPKGFFDANEPFQRRSWRLFDAREGNARASTVSSRPRKGLLEACERRLGMREVFSDASEGLLDVTRSFYGAPDVFYVPAEDFYGPRETFSDASDGFLNLSDHFYDAS